MDDILLETEEKMQKALENLNERLKNIRAGRANPAILDGVKVNYEKFKNTDLHKAYTVYFVVYWPEENKDPIFFNGSEWKKEYPWKGDGQNTFKVNGQDMKLQFYFIKAPGDNASKMSNYCYWYN